MNKSETQWCRRCQKDKPVREFYISCRTRCMRCVSECAKERLSDPGERQQQRDRCKKNYYKNKGMSNLQTRRELGEVGEQWCRTCEKHKPPSAFYPCHRTMCMDCKKARKRKALRECVTDLCHSCSKWKPQSQFDINSRGDRVMSTCSVCTRKKKEAREKKNLTTISLHELNSQQPEKVEVKKDLWYLWKGTVHLFIIGPSEFAMHRCTEPAYSGRIGTNEERAIAKMAIKKLNDDLVNNFDKGPEIIKKALNEARAEYDKQKHTHKNE